jgi:phage terminase large subunit-like protein
MGYEGKGSPDRADAMVWAMTELMLGKGRAEPRISFL